MQNALNDWKFTRFQNFLIESAICNFEDFSHNRYTFMSEFIDFQPFFDLPSWCEQGYFPDEELFSVINEFVHHFCPIFMVYFARKCGEGNRALVGR